MADGSQDPASLENLHDIIVPGPVSWWPPALGWYVLGILVLIATILLLSRATLRWRNNRYRREALAQLAMIRRSSRHVDGPSVAIAQLAELLKRVALAAWPREVVAHLTGQRWLEFLQATGRGQKFPQDSLLVLRDIAYSRKIRDELSRAQVDELFIAAGDWINEHDASA